MELSDVLSTMGLRMMEVTYEFEPIVIDDSWVVPEKRSDWGALFYTLPGDGYSDSGTVSFSRGRLEFVPDSTFDVLTPAGVQGVGTIVFTSYASTVGDMGRTIPVIGSVPQIRHDASGR